MLPWLARGLSSLRDLALSLGFTALVLFPLPPLLWQLLGQVWPEAYRHYPLLALLFPGWDGGAQQPVGRALFRALCLSVLVVGYSFPARSGWRRPAWFVPGEFALGCGLLAALFAEHRFAALLEWQTWLLAGLWVYLVASQWQPRWSALLVGCGYLMTVLLLLHSLLLGLPYSERLGGPLHHPNAYSTLLLLLLPVMGQRALSCAADSRLGQVGAGVLIGLTLCTGSLTGAALLTAGAWAAVLDEVGGARRWSGSCFAGGLVLGANFLGGWLSLLTAPGLLLAAWLYPMTRGKARGWLKSTVLGAFTVGLLLIVQVVLAPPGGEGSGALPRTSSFLARAEFYRVGLGLAVQNLLLGVGPGGFQRYYPAGQSELAYFSRFPHGWPVEIASEWGVPALLALGAMLLGLAREGGSSGTRRCAGQVLVIFLLHASTDTQTQFPYLLFLAASALGALGAGRVEAEYAVESWSTRLTRALIALGCLALLTAAVPQLQAAWQRNLATALARRVRTEEGARAVEALLGNAQALDPLDSEGVRLWGVALLAGGQPQGASELSRLGLELDPRRAALHYLALGADPPSPQQAEQAYREAIALDRLNYPIFYRWLAEALAAQGQGQEARSVMRAQAPHYAPDQLQAVLDFRREDLTDQLVEFHALLAVLEERNEKSTGEAEFRLSLQCCYGYPARLRRLRAYLGSLTSGPLAAEAGALLEKLPAQDLPAAVEPPRDHP